MSVTPAYKVGDEVLVRAVIRDVTSAGIHCSYQVELKQSGILFWTSGLSLSLVPRESDRLGLPRATHASVLVSLPAPSVPEKSAQSDNAAFLRRMRTAAERAENSDDEDAGYSSGYSEALRDAHAVLSKNGKGLYQEDYWTLKKRSDVEREISRLTEELKDALPEEPLQAQTYAASCVSGSAPVEKRGVVRQDGNGQFCWKCFGCGADLKALLPPGPDLMCADCRKLQEQAAASGSVLLEDGGPSWPIIRHCDCCGLKLGESWIERDGKKHCNSCWQKRNQPVERKTV